jgi:hypothetical protein
MEIAVNTSAMIHLWIEQALPTMACARAFALLKYGSIQDHPYYEPLLLSVARLAKHRQNGVTSPKKLTRATESLALNLVQFPEEDWLSLIPDTDRLKPMILERANLEIAFRRDPKGSIDLEAFARDPQSVHRSSVQESLQKGLDFLMAVPLTSPLDAFNEIIAEYMNANLFRLKRPVCLALATDIDTLSVQLETHLVVYADLLNHLWTYIRNHIHKAELVKRLMEELEEGVNTCGNGKVSRLVNVLAGFEDGIGCGDLQEAFQTKMAALRPLTDRLYLAQELFREYAIPVDQQIVWLQALEES